MDERTITHTILEGKKLEISEAVLRITRALKAQNDLPDQDLSSARLVHDKLDSTLQVLHQAVEEAEGGLFDQKARTAEKAIDEVIYAIPLARLKEIHRLFLWTSGGALAMGAVDPPYRPETRQEGHQIAARWNKMSGSSCYIDALEAMIREASE